MSPEAPVGCAHTAHRRQRLAALKSITERIASALRPSANDTEFMSETSAVALEGPRYFTHCILWGTLGFFILAFVWAAIAKVDEFTVAEGKVIPSSQVQVVQNLEGGILSEILVQVGQTVEKGHNKQIADELAVSVETVKKHLKSIFVKLNVQRRTQVALKKG